tara:strand:+ start:121 stop:582 length:462 start_codon:yes stop_codon:yes gene_type:complete
MANTYSQVNIHCVFAVKGHENLLSKQIRPHLFRYMHGILKNHGIHSLAINGWTDYVHVFFELPMTLNISEVMRDLKASSSKWINDNRFLRGHFQWQEGYGAFSYSRSQRDTVINYILNQEKHHAKRSFKEEYLELLQKFDVSFDENYLFDFFD